MKRTTRKSLTWVTWAIILFLLCAYFALNSPYDSRPLLYKFRQELWNIGLPYLFFTFFYILAFTQKQYRKMLYLIALDIICIIFMVGGIYWFYEGKKLGAFSVVLFIIFTTFKAAVLIIKTKPTKA